MNTQAFGSRWKDPRSQQGSRILSFVSHSRSIDSLIVLLFVLTIFFRFSLYFALVSCLAAGFFSYFL